jgi:hypothetical protein
MNKSTISKSVQPPIIIRRRLGALTIEASPLGDGRVGFVVQGPPAALSELASGLSHAGWSVEQYPDDPEVLYAEGRGEEPTMDIGAAFDDEEPPTVRYPKAWRESGPVEIGGAG